MVLTTVLGGDVKPTNTMPKDRPIKSFRLDGERPFKAYNPGITPSLLFADSLHHDQQKASQPRSATIQQTQLRLRPYHQNPLSININQRQHEIFNDPGEYLRLRTHLQLGFQNPVTSPDRFKYDYEDVTQDIPNNQSTRPTLDVTNESASHRDELDPKLFNPTTSVGGLQNVIVPVKNPNKPPASGSLGTQHTISKLLENSMTLFRNGLPRVMDNATSSNYNPFTTGYLSQGFPTPLHSVSGLDRHQKAMAFLGNTDNFPVKQEFPEGSIIMRERNNHSINSTEQSRDICHSSMKYKIETAVANCSLLSAGTFTGNVSTGTFPGNVSTAISYHNHSSDDKSTEELSRDQSYLEKRRKNNESAKRSREARRTKEELVALRVIELEKKNMILHAEIRMLDKELDELRTKLYQFN